MGTRAAERFPEFLQAFLGKVVGVWKVARHDVVDGGEAENGNVQRMRLAAALVHDPEVLILDEPMNGTDPRQRIEFHDLMRRLASEGRTVLVSSHILEEVETVADRHLLMVSGKLAASDEFRAIRDALDQQPYKVRVVCEAPRAMASALVVPDRICVT